VAYKQEWTAEVLGYAKNYLAKHVWRIRPQMDLDDALQEAYILFMQLVDRYDYENPKYFMAVWKIALHNSVCDWVQRRTQSREVRLSLRMLEWLPKQLPKRSTDNAIDNERISDALVASTAWEHHVEGATGYVRQLLDAVRSRPYRPRRRRRGGCRLTTNEYLCRFAGISPSIPLRKVFETWLSDVCCPK